ncbi:hypothetical protein K6959_10070 [Bacillus aquiflavi]|uniref:hypothetical protein n=1 Tax=Bacillus aquiflavi TaxID=2672567 RepID=UPI001CA8AE9E|nr:hypothetical protein [Bacillus aquiflavi]UAC47103.1 hypothetical protein K6959_10070 [Bacillus aquiflavi]
MCNKSPPYSFGFDGHERKKGGRGVCQYCGAKAVFPSEHKKRNGVDNGLYTIPLGIVETFSDVFPKQKVTQIIQSLQNNVGSIELLINNASVGFFDYAENLSEDSIPKMIDIN